jgi:hypothetical protein
VVYRERYAGRGTVYRMHLIITCCLSVMQHGMVYSKEVSRMLYVEKSMQGMVQCTECI